MEDCTSSHFKNRKIDPGLLAFIHNKTIKSLKSSVGLVFGLKRIRLSDSTPISLGLKQFYRCFSEEFWDPDPRRTHYGLCTRGQLTTGECYQDHSIQSPSQTSLPCPRSRVKFWINSPTSWCGCKVQFGDEMGVQLWPHCIHSRLQSWMRGNIYEVCTCCCWEGCAFVVEQKGERGYGRYCRMRLIGR